MQLSADPLGSRLEPLIGIASLMLAVLALALQQGWLPRKYEMVDSHPLRDSKIEPIFGPASVFDTSPRAARVVARDMMPKYKSNGFKVVRVAFGREFPFGRVCVWRGKVSDGSIQECVLMARPIDTKAAPFTPPPSGRELVYASSTVDLPKGLAPERVVWVRQNQLAGRTKVLDNSGREWRMQDPGGDLFLVFQK